MRKIIWKSVDEFNGLYEVSSDAKIRATPKQYNSYTFQILKPFLDQKKYLKVRLSQNDISVDRTIHRLVAKAFIANPKGDKYVKHLNGIKTDNRILNLEWCTKSEYIKHAFLIGLNDKKGENNGRSQLNNNQVLEIFNSQKPRIELANQFSISLNCVDNIKSGYTWSHLTKKNKALSKKILTEKQIIEIFLSKSSTKEISKKYTISYSNIYRIKNKKMWINITQNLSF